MADPLGVDSGTYTDSGAKMKRRIAEALLAGGVSTAPVQHWTQGAARVAQALAGGWMANQADTQERERDAATTRRLMNLPGLGGGDQVAQALVVGAPKPGTTPDGAGTMDSYRSAISRIESGSEAGDYGALGPTTQSGDRAYGRYQVMGANIPAWTERWAGRRMTPQEFLQSREAQDAVFNGQFGEYVQRYGPDRAAAAWFAGEGGMNNPGARDQLGTSVAEYTRRFATGAPSTSPAQPPGGVPGAPVTPGAPTVPGSVTPPATGQPGGAGATIPPQMAAAILTLLDDPQTRQAGMALYVQIAGRGSRSVVSVRLPCGIQLQPRSAGHIRQRHQGAGAADRHRHRHTSDVAGASSP
jgi:hypothetical protein